MVRFLFSVFVVLLYTLKLCAAETKTLNVYNWANYIDPVLVDEFQKETGIQVIYDVYDSNYLLESKILIASSSGYDIVVPSTSPFLIRQIAFGLYQKIDKSRLNNYKNLDSNVLQIIQKHGDALDYSIPYSWNSTAIGYNKVEVEKKLDNAPKDSWAMVFDPEIVKHFASCGVEIIDSPMEVIAMILAYYGKEPYSDKIEDLEFAREKLEKIRPYIKSINNNSYVDNLANGETCLVIGFSGDIIQARNRAKEVGNGVDIKIAYPKEASEIGVDAMAILADAPNVDNAYKFIDFVLRPENSARITNFTSYPTINAQSAKFVDKDILADKDIILDISKLANPCIANAVSSKYEKIRTKVWLKFISGNIASTSAGLKK